jgi:sporulation protein YlmC with PRC-barrel domain
VTAGLALLISASIGAAQQPRDTAGTPPDRQRAPGADRKGEGGTHFDAATVGDEQQERDVRRARDRARADNLGLMRATKLTGAKVANTQDQSLGSIDNLAIATIRGTIAYAVIGFGGIAGLGETKFAIPWRALDVRTDDRAVLDVDKEMLKNTPGFKGNDWPQVADARWLTRAGADRPGELREVGDTERERSADALPQYSFKSSDLIGKVVKGTNGDKLGSIKDLMVDPQRGRIVYGIIAHGGVLGIGDRLVAVPWGAFDTREQDSLRIDLDKAKLEAGPNFADGDWSVLSDPEFLARTYSYYGQPAYDSDKREGSGERMRDGRERDRGERPAGAPAREAR